MRRFSQRSHLVTLSEINITPLLDLAFVLLIIFVITTPLIEQSINLRLPTGGRTDQKVDQRDIATVEIAKNGAYFLDRRAITLPELERSLVAASRLNPNTIVYIRADEEGLNKHLYAVIDRCLRNDITRFSLRTEPPGVRR
jgi:biopolymer transport protein ExbD